MAAREPPAPTIADCKVRLEEARRRSATALKEEKACWTNLQLAESSFWKTRYTAALKKLEEEREKGQELTRQLEGEREKSQEVARQLGEEREKNEEIARQLGEEREKNEEIARQLGEEREKNRRITGQLDEADKLVATLEAQVSKLKQQKGPNYKLKRLVAILAAQLINSESDAEP